ncbi:MAG TPA: hypothetical protein DEA90_08625 [Opitutae bacterium]|nr:hypothetical protein [Puniceicoccaceae bacterium]HBR94214.1 hypothetical protein [Opitutae bacterium]|tara:strand:+ start:199 stop:495 length:297 start_codon:yes stop_codon:yes gene_type:complete
MKYPHFKTLIAVPAVLLASYGFASAVDVGFTGNEGYADGTGLNGNANWSAAGSILIESTATTGSAVLDPTNDNATARYTAESFDFGAAAVGTVFFYLP